MNDILYRAAAYLLIIALGVFLKKVGFLHEQDFRTLAKILLNITLPCAIIYSFFEFVRIQYRKFLPAVCTELFRAAQSSWHHII